MNLFPRFDAVGPLKLRADTWSVVFHSIFIRALIHFHFIPFSFLFSNFLSDSDVSNATRIIWKVYFVRFNAENLMSVEQTIASILFYTIICANFAWIFIRNQKVSLNVHPYVQCTESSATVAISSSWFVFFVGHYSSLHRETLLFTPTTSSLHHFPLYHFPSLHYNARKSVKSYRRSISPQSEAQMPRVLLHEYFNECGSSDARARALLFLQCFPFLHPPSLRPVPRLFFAF